jgi:predicted regulator of Ras-like GTPase activity (Roadblock/LC7/MglB family)
VSAFGELLDRVNRISGVRGSMVVSADDGLIVAEDLMVGVPGPAAAALVASLFRRARKLGGGGGIRQRLVPAGGGRATGCCSPPRRRS